MSPSSSPPRNISRMAMSVRITVAVANRPGRRRSSLSASFTSRPPGRWSLRSGRSATRVARPRANSVRRATTAGSTRRSPRGSRIAGRFLRGPVARAGSRGACRSSSPIPMMTTTWIRSDETSRPAGAPIARSSVSEFAFWNVTIRKNRPVTHGTTSPYSRKMMLNDCCTCATPGVSAAASCLVRASRSSDCSLIDVTVSSGVYPSAGMTPSTLGSGVPASGFTLLTAPR